MSSPSDSPPPQLQIANRKPPLPHSLRLLRVLAGKSNILITTHVHPDPDALASCHALMNLLTAELPDARVTMSIKGRIAGGINEAFTRLSTLKLTTWNPEELEHYDAIILLDTQPTFAYSPLPHNLLPTAVIDHHRSRARGGHIPFRDVRPDVGATSTIVFSYFIELGVPISPELAASLLYAIESDLAGMAGTPDDMDNVALSSLTLLADTNKLYKMRLRRPAAGLLCRFVPGPQKRRDLRHRRDFPS